MLTPPVQLTTRLGPSSGGPSFTGQSSAGQWSSASETAVPETAVPETAVPETAVPETGQSTTEGVSVTTEEPWREGARLVIIAGPVRSGITLTSLTRSCHDPHGQAAIPYAKIISNHSDIFRS